MLLNHTVSAITSVLVLSRSSLQGPVDSQTTQPVTNPHQAAAHTFGVPSSLYHLVKNRPFPRGEGFVAALRTFQEDFASHPAVKAINLKDTDKIKVAEQLDGLRGYVMDRGWNKKMTTSIEHHLRGQNAGKDLFNTFGAHNYNQRRVNARESVKRKIASMDPEQIEQRKRRKAELRSIRRIKVQEDKRDGGKARPVQQPFEEVLDQMLGDSRLTAEEITKMAEQYRFSHFQAEQSFTLALSKYLERKGFTNKEITVAIAGRSKIKLQVGSRERRRYNRLNSGSVKSGPAKTSIKHLSAPPSAASTVPDAAQLASSSTTSNRSKDTVDQLEDSPWWDHHEW